MNISKDELKKLLSEIDTEKESEAETKREEKVEDKKVEADININDTLSKLAENLVTAVKTQLGGDAKDAEALKARIYSEKDGLKTIKSPSVKELGNLSDSEKIGAFFKSLFHSHKTSEDIAILKGLSEGSDADGGYLVPTPLHSEVYRLLGDLAVMRKLATEIPMTSETLKIPTLTADPAAYWIGERVTKTTTSAEFSQPTLTANKLVARILISEELNDDAIVAMVPFITNLFAEKIAAAEDKAFFTGTGTGQPRGISIETITSPAASATFVFDDLITLMNSVRQSVRDARNAAFIGNNKVLQKIYKMKDTSNQYIWRMPGGSIASQTDRLPEMIYGRPIYEQNDLPSRELYFGDWSKYFIGDRKQLYVKTTDQNETAWTQDAIDIKAVERVDGRASILGAFAKLTNC